MAQTHETAVFSLVDEAASLAFSEDLAVILVKGDCLLLSGDLGVGKTTIARGIIRSVLGDLEAEVPSPTFSLVNAYEEGRAAIYHFDLYRLSSVEELEETGFDDALVDGITLIEWPDRANGFLPDDAVLLELTEDGTGRRAVMTANQGFLNRSRRTTLIRKLLDDAGYEGCRRIFLQGDASLRSYEKVKLNSKPDAVLMNWPRQEDGAILKDGKTYSELAHLAQDVGPFVAIGETLRRQNFPAPEIYSSDLDNGILLLEDFGSETVVVNGGPVPERYEACIDLLARMHLVDWSHSAPINDVKTHEIPAFDWEIIEIEISLLLEWYAPLIAEKSISDEAAAEYKNIWFNLFKKLQASEQSLVLRDFHSPNLMWRAAHSGEQQIGLIDYQDALIGPSAYDVASLCQDARVDVSDELEQSLKSRYCNAREENGSDFDPVIFEEAYAIIAAERGTRLLGLWPRLKHRDNKPHYMQHMPRTLDYLSRVMHHSTLKPLSGWYQKNLGLF